MENLPFNQNINWAAAAIALGVVFAWLFPNIPPNVRDAIMVLLGVGGVLVISFLHTFINHPANAAAAEQMASKAVQVAKRAGPVIAILLVFGIMGMALSACSTASAGTTPAPASSPSVSAPAVDPIQQISQFTVTDLQNADADAVSNNDTIAHACYPAMIQFIKSLPGSNGSTTVSGAFSAFQKARDLRNTVAAGVPTYLTMGCGPLYAQVHADLLTFLAGGLAGQAVVTVATAP